jgi:hypothetical protein
MSFYDDVLEDHNDRLGFNPENPTETGLSDCTEGKFREHSAHLKAVSGDNEVEHFYRLDNGVQKHVTMLKWSDMLGSGFDYLLHFDRKKIQEALEGNVYEKDGVECDISAMWNFKHFNKREMNAKFGMEFHTNKKDDTSFWATVSEYLTISVD